MLFIRNTCKKKTNNTLGKTKLKIMKKIMGTCNTARQFSKFEFLNKIDVQEKQQNLYQAKFDLLKGNQYYRYIH